MSNKVQTKTKYNVTSVIDTGWRKKPAVAKVGESAEQRSRQNSDTPGGAKSIDEADLIANLNEYGSDVKVNGRIATKKSLQKLANRYAEIKKKKEQTSWRSVVQNALDLQKGKVPLLLAVEAGNQSMCRELLSAQTAEQLKVSGEQTN